MATSVNTLSRALDSNVVSDARPPTEEVPMSVPCSSTRRVKISMWRASSAAWTA